MSLSEVIMAQKIHQKIWVAVRVWRGFPVEAKGYRNRESAEKQAQIWRKDINLDYDDTGVLEIKMD